MRITNSNATFEGGYGCRCRSGRGWHLEIGRGHQNQCHSHCTVIRRNSVIWSTGWNTALWLA